MKIISTFLIISFLIGCACPKFYIPDNKTTQNITIFKNNDLNISCDIPAGSPQTLNILLWFDETVKQETINKISINFLFENGEIMDLKGTNIYSSQIEGSGSVNDKRYNTANFIDLPENVRTTTINGSRVTYNFNFKSDKPIISKEMKLSYTVELRSGKTIKAEQDLILNKSCHWAFSR